MSTSSLPNIYDNSYICATSCSIITCVIYVTGSVTHMWHRSVFVRPSVIKITRNASVALISIYCYACMSVVIEI